MTRVSGILMKSSRLMKSMMVIEDHISHQIGTVMTTGPGQDHLKTAHTGKEIDIPYNISNNNSDCNGTSHSYISAQVICELINFA